VKWVTEKQLDDDLFARDLTGQSAQAGFILIGWRAGRKLLAVIQGELLLQAKGSLIVDFAVALHKAHRRPKFLRRRSVHPHEQSAAVAVAAGPAFDKPVELFPAAQVEIADAEVGVIGNLHRLL
jgi:hypothetical protein